jgi:hypothetical protein
LQWQFNILRSAIFLAVFIKDVDPDAEHFDKFFLEKNCAPMSYCVFDQNKQKIIFSRNAEYFDDKNSYYHYYHEEINSNLDIKYLTEKAQLKNIIFIEHFSYNEHHKNRIEECVKNNNYSDDTLFEPHNRWCLFTKDLNKLYLEYKEYFNEKVEIVTTTACADQKLIKENQELRRRNDELNKNLCQLKQTNDALEKSNKTLKDESKNSALKINSLNNENLKLKNIISYQIKKYLTSNALVRSEPFIELNQNLSNIRNIFIDPIIKFDIEEYIDTLSEEGKKPNIDEILKLTTIQTIINDPKQLGENRPELNEFYEQMKGFSQDPKLVLQKLIKDCCEIYLQEYLSAEQPSTTLESTIDFSKKLGI